MILLRFLPGYRALLARLTEASTRIVLREDELRVARQRVAELQERVIVLQAETASLRSELLSDARRIADCVRADARLRTIWSKAEELNPPPPMPDIQPVPTRQRAEHLVNLAEREFEDELLRTSMQ